MKKYFIIFIALLLAASTCAIYSTAVLHSRRDDITFTREVVAGDIAAAEGITVTLRNELNSRLGWDMTMKNGDENNTETLFEFTPYRFPYRHNYDYYGFQISSMSSYVSMGGNIDFEEEHADPYLSPLMHIWKDVASRAPAGMENYTETVAIADYFEYYPLYISFSTDLNVNETENAEKLFSDIFKIPVPEDHKITVSISKDSAGNAYEAESRAEKESAEYTINSTGAITEKGVWFSWEFSEHPMADMEGMPENGIWFFPLEPHESGKWFAPDVARTELLYPTDRRISFVCSSKDSSRILFITSDENGKNASLGVMDAATGNILQDIPFTDNYVPLGIEVEEDYIFISTDNSGFAVFSEENGIYTLEMCSEYMKNPHELAPYYYYSDTDFSNGKFVILCLSHRTLEKSFHLQVFDKTGILYHGSYTNDAPSYTDHCTVSFGE